MSKRSWGNDFQNDKAYICGKASGNTGNLIETFLAASYFY